MLRFFQAALAALVFLMAALPVRADNPVNSDGYVEQDGLFFKAGAVGTAFSQKPIWELVAGHYVRSGYGYQWQASYYRFVRFEYAPIKVESEDQAQAIIKARAAAQNTMAIAQQKHDNFLETMSKAGLLENMKYEGYFGGRSPCVPGALTAAGLYSYGYSANSYGAYPGGYPQPNAIDPAVLSQQSIRMVDGVKEVYALALSGHVQLTEQQLRLLEQHQKIAAIVAVQASPSQNVTITQTGPAPLVQPAPAPVKFGRRLGVAKCASCHAAGGQAPEFSTLDSEEVVKRMILPMSDAKHMPPREAPQLTAEEQMEVIRVKRSPPVIGPPMPAAKD